MKLGTNGHRQPEDVEHEIDVVRHRLDATIRELERRRHDAFDIKRQIRRHAIPAIGVVAALAASVAVLTVWLVRRHGRRRRLWPRMQRLQHAVTRMVAKPDRVARENPNVGRKIAAAAGTTAATMLAKKLLHRVIDREPKSAAAAGD